MADESVPSDAVAGCYPNAEGALIPAPLSHDCSDRGADGPRYVGLMSVVAKNRCGLNADGDGVGCE